MIILNAINQKRTSFSQVLLCYKCLYVRYVVHTSVKIHLLGLTTTATKNTLHKTKHMKQIPLLVVLNKRTRPNKKK